MPYSRPTIQAIAARARTDLATALESAAALYRASFERSAVNALTGTAHGLYGNIAWIARQIDPRTADDDIVEKVHGEPYGIFKKDAVATRLRVVATGTNGAIVPAGTAYQRADTAAYTVDALGTVTLLSVTLDITAAITGDAGNMKLGDTLTIGSPIAGVAGTATVTEILRVGSDRESPQSYLDRVIHRRQTPPNGGGLGDYEGWALEVPGITRAWEYPGRGGLGTVTVYMVNDDDDPISVDGAKLLEVADYMEQPGRQPTTAEALLYTPTLVPLAMTIAISPDTPAVRAAIETQLDDALERAGHPGGMTVYLSQLNEAISIAPGEFDHILSIPSDNTPVPFGSIPVRGAITWSAL